MPQTDILIIGAGPTGLTLALELASQAPPPTLRIIEATPLRSNKSRAFVLHPRTLELLSRHGIAEQFVAKGRYNDAVRFYSKRAFVYELGLKGDVMASDTQFGMSLMISQAETEAVLEDAIRKLGVVVERGVSAESVVQDSEEVTCVLKITGEGGEEREEEVKCKFVVGCDGAHSVVRKSAGIKFEGGVYPQDFILADVHVKWEHPPCLSMFLGHGFMGVFPLPNNVFRLIVSRASEKGKEDEPTLKDFQDAVDELVPGTTELFDPVWIARFRLHHRIVDCYRKGRCFVAGDAAHIHSPAGGQGMNTGMQDAINLGWKLASVLRGQSSDALLDTYDIERRKVGLKLLHGTDRMFELMSTTNPLFLYLRNTLVGWVVPWVMGDTAATQKRFRFISQLGIRYRESSIVGQASTWKGRLRGGDRAPDGNLSGDGKKWLLGLCSGVGFHLLLFSGVGDVAVSEVDLEAVGSEFCKDGGKAVMYHKVLSFLAADGNGNIDAEGKVHELYGFKEPGYVLVRPDGYISFIGLLNTKDELDAWVKK